jgi:hypothetical protein
MVMGSPGFTAPERIRGSDATPASDLWSLGATIYAAVEGRGPYEQRGGAITTMSAIINEDAPVAPHAGQLAPVIAALLRRDPSTRPSASAAARMFAQVLPRLSDVTQEPPAMSHPPTVRSAYLPSPAAPVASVPVTSPEDTGLDKKPGSAAAKQPAAETPPAEEPAKEAPAKEAPESPAAGEADEAALVISADPAGDADSAESAAESKSESAAESEPVVVAESIAASVAAPEAESEPAAETAEFKVPAPEAAEIPVPQAAPADAPAAESKAPAVMPQEEGPVEEEASSRAAETVIPDKSARYQPTQVSIPVARVASPTPAKPNTIQPKAAEPKPAPPKPGPTFTAAKPTDRAAPTFSAASPSPVTPARPARPVTPPPDQRPAYGSSSAGQGYPPPTPPKGGTAPFPPSGGQYGPPVGQYAGPAQPYPDLSKLYTPGKVGRVRRGRGQSGRIIWLVVAVLIAAAIGVGAALALNHNSTDSAANAGNTSAANNPTVVPSVEDTPTGFQSVDALNDPSTALPAADWSKHLVTATDAHSAAAGFSIDIPPGWTETRKGLATDFTGPGDLIVEVDLTGQPTSNMLAAAGQVEKASTSRFPGYKRVKLQAEPVRHAEGAVWKFTWTPAAGQQFTVDDIFFAQQTSAGVQDYAVYIRSPASTFGTTSLPLFDKILRTFQTVTGS